MQAQSVIPARLREAVVIHVFDPIVFFYQIRLPDGLPREQIGGCLKFIPVIRCDGKRKYRGRIWNSPRNQLDNAGNKVGKLIRETAFPAVRVIVCCRDVIGSAGLQIGDRDGSIGSHIHHKIVGTTLGAVVDPVTCHRSVGAGIPGQGQALITPDSLRQKKGYEQDPVYEAHSRQDGDDDHALSRMEIFRDGSRRADSRICGKMAQDDFGVAPTKMAFI